MNCTFCHGKDARGGDGGGPNLLRSIVMLNDAKGELIGPIVQKGQGAMPPIPLTSEQVVDVAAFLHSLRVATNGISSPLKVDIVVGDAAKGKRYVADHCETCHATADLQAFAKRIADPKVLQQNWLLPGSGGYGPGLAVPPGGLQPPPVRAVVTLSSGERLEGTVDRINDFTITLNMAGDRQRTVRTGEGVRVELNDPLKPHKDRLPLYTDPDIHNVTAYLVSLREPK